MIRNAQFYQIEGPEAGSLLVAHPSMLDPNFSRTVVFLTAHSSDDGSIGVVVNRETGQTLGDFAAEFSDSSLFSVPIFEGGPVASEKLILAAWKWVPSDSVFKLYFGIDQQKAEAMLESDPDLQIRAYLGHAGWSEGQLDDEISQGAWVISRLLPELEEKGGEDVWRSLLCHEDPMMKLFTDAPDDPSLN